jgi:hypothetical protein
MKKKVEHALNETYIKGNLVYIRLAGKNGTGYSAITDIKSYLKYELDKFKWSCTKLGYVYATINSRTTYMHRLITENTTRKHTDHIKNTNNSFLDKMDNRACNLRKASNQQNQQNARKRIDNTTGYKGVNFDKNIYKAQMRINKKKLYFGGFNVLKQKNALLMSACIYDVVSEYVFGEYADHNNIIENNLLTLDELKVVYDMANKYITKHNVSKFEVEQVVYDSIVLDGELTSVYEGVLLDEQMVG